jgi:hypothetical protein
MPENENINQTPEIPLPLTGAETSPENLTPQNDADTKGVAAPESALRKKVRKSVAKIFNAAGIVYKAGRGRPKNCSACGGDGCDKCGWTGKEPKKSDVPIQPAGDDNAPNESADRVETQKLDVEFPAEQGGQIPAVAVPDFNARVDALFRKCVAGGAKGVPEGLNEITRVLANQAGIDKDFTEKTLARAKPEPDALDNFADSVDLVLSKHAPQLKEGGEWSCLALSTARLAAPYGVLWYEFIKEIQRKKREGK